ncbi:DUF5681 domain-containing protein [Novosphingobium aquae]|uniref:DUF5681 domain-containing protein n=1 Tax=Novosphingobium aquae TaxID=3133435 RepID=A0ABU8SDR8_9SPHN
MSDNKLPVPASGQAVGYGRPPAQHRFQKGRSGNPGGRPRGAKNKPKPLDPALQPTDNLILEEAYRPVTIREGEKTIELPAIQAAVRSLAISAMKGSRLSQRALAELVRTVEERKSSERLTSMENAFEYQQKWTEELERRRKLGITDLPDPVPHPDDIVIDMRTGHVRTEGPLDEREKKDWEKRIARRAEAQDEVNAFAEKWRKARGEKQKEFWLAEWHFEQRIFDIINDGMPERYKVKLQNRSWAKGASREGKALEEFRRDR